MTEGKSPRGSENDASQSGARASISETELDALLASVSAPPASEALKRRMLDDHLVVAASTVRTRPERREASVWSSTKAVMHAGWAGLVRNAAPAGAFAALASLGFYVGVSDNGPVDEAAYLYVASAFIDVADDVEEGSIWAE